jgi:hypothetical protein
LAGTLSATSPAPACTRATPSCQILRQRKNGQCPRREQNPKSPENAPTVSRAWMTSSNSSGDMDSVQAKFPNGGDLAIHSNNSLSADQKSNHE